MYSDEGITARIETRHRFAGGKISVVISPLPVLRFMEYGSVFYLHLAGGIISLKVRHIIVRFPQAPFHETPQSDSFSILGEILQLQMPDFVPGFQGDEIKDRSLQSVFCSSDFRITESVSTFVRVKRYAH